MRRKKQGASLIMVVIIFMFITTVSMSMLSMIASNYKARVMESKRIENLYASDSGLDVAYNIIAKTFDSATKYGYYKVQTLKSLKGNSNSPNNTKYQDLEDDIKALNNDILVLKNEEPTETRTRKNINDEIKRKNDLIDESKNLEQLLLNEEFKRTFKNFIYQSLESGENEVASGKLQDSINNHKFVEVNIDSNNNIKFIDKIINFNNNAAPTLSLTSINNPTNISINSETKIISIPNHYKNVSITVTPQQKYENITVTSNFYTEKFNGNNNYNGNRTNERTLQETFDMVIPNFKDVYYQEISSGMHKYLATQDRAITVKGNMNITGANNFLVNGEIFVEGNAPDINVTAGNRSFEKYNGGIMIANSNNVNFNDNVITRNNFNIRNDAVVTIGKNLYGRNVYLGGDLSKGLNEPATKSTLYVNKGDNSDDSKGQIIIDNDLALKAQDSQIYVKDFLGINDKNIGDKDKTGKLVNKVKSSSSIIVNTSDNSKIDINNSAYIMGTAHINTNETSDDPTNEYQTGESGAVKGNYIAYSVPLNDTEGFFYYDPLQLFDTINGEKANVFDKSEHFTNYWQGQINNDQADALNTGGILLPHKSDGTVNNDNIWSLGVIVYEVRDKDGNISKKVIGSHYMQEQEQSGGIIYNKQTEFAKKVYRFNETATKKYDYDYEKLTEFSDIVETKNIVLDTSYVLNNQNNKGEYAIFNGGSSKEIKIVKSNNSTDSIQSNSNEIIISVSNKGTIIDPKYNLNAVIVTAGNLSIDDNITINGCLIVEGNLNIDKQNITVNYDPEVIERVQAKNSEIFETVFGGWIIAPDDTPIDSTNKNLQSSYDLNSFLQKKLWKINK